MNPADIATRGLALLKLVGNMFWRHGPELSTLPKTSWPQVHVADNFNSHNISGTSNNGMLCISINIDKTVNKNVQFSIYKDSCLLEVIAVSHNLVI